MANEITVLASLSCLNGNLNIRKESGAIRVNQTTAGGGQPGTISATTTDTAITISGVSAPKWAYFRNIGSNPVKIGPTSGGAIVSMVQLAAGEPAVLPLVPSVALRCQTTTGTTTLEIVTLET